MALQNGLVFGEDFVFTYGPLGVLTTRLPIGLNIGILVLFDLFVILNICFLVQKIFVHLKLIEKWLLGALIILTSDFYKWDIVPLMHFLMLCHLILYVKYHKLWHLVVSSVFGVALFFCKANFGVVSLGCLVGLLIILVFNKKADRIELLGIASLIAILTFVSAFFLKVDIISYLKGNLELAFGFQEALLLPMDSAIKAVFIVFISLLILSLPVILIIQFRNQSKPFYKLVNPINGAFLLIFTISIYVIYKQSIVRFDGAHYPTIIRFFVPFALLVLYSFFKIDKIAKQYLASISILVSLAFADMTGFRPLRDTFDQLVSTKEYYKTLFSEPIEEDVSTYPVSESIKESIGDNSIDIVPTEISLAFVNGWNYRGRPVIQSYSGYTEYLDNLNADFFLEPDAPNLILYSDSTIEKRYPFFDEPQTKLNLLLHYKPIDADSNYVLLKKQDKPLKFNLKAESKINLALNEFYPLEDSKGLIFADFKINYNLFGWFRKLIYQPPTLNITFYLEDGQKKTHRLVKGATYLLLINKYISGIRGSSELFMNPFDLPSNVIGIKIHSEFTSHFSPLIDMRVQNVIREF
ncbi:MAG: hypothetical protein RJQ09_02660 [Cyclobacteriaceae bacterium]